MNSEFIAHQHSTNEFRLARNQRRERKGKRENRKDNTPQNPQSQTTRKI